LDNYDQGFAFLINEYQLVYFYVNVTSYQIIIIRRVPYTRVPFPPL